MYIAPPQITQELPAVTMATEWSSVALTYTVNSTFAVNVVWGRVGGALPPGYQWYTNEVRDSFAYNTHACPYVSYHTGCSYPHHSYSLIEKLIEWSIIHSECLQYQLYYIEMYTMLQHTHSLKISRGAPRLITKLCVCCSIVYNAY